MEKMIPPAIENEYEPHKTEMLKPQQATTSSQRTVFDWEKLIRELVMKHPKEIKSLLADLDEGTQEIIFQMVEEKYPTFSGITRLVLGNNGNASRTAQDAQGNDFNRNPLDDNYQEKSYDIPDTEILDEIRQFACSLHLGGYGWAQISDQIFTKYDVDWNPLKVKDIVLKSLAWDYKKHVLPPKQVTEQVATVLPEPHKGLVRKVIHWLY